MVTQLARISVCLTVLVLVLCEYAYAVPAFARREGVTCQMCHFRMPELNEDGHDYVRRGLREEPPAKMTDVQEPAGKPMEGMQQESQPEAPADAGAKQPLGQPLSINWANYLTAMGHHMYVLESGQRAAFDAGTIDVWAAGPFSPNWSALANPSFNIEEGGSDVDEAYGHYITRWANQFGSARFGQLQPFAVLLNQGGPKMSLSDPLVLSVSGDAGSNWTPESLVRGLELGAVDLGRGTVYAGAGQPRLEDSPLTDQAGFEHHTDFFGSGEWIITDRGDSLTVYGYKGSAWLSPAAPDKSFHRVGFFGNIYGPATKGTVGFLTGSDDAVDRSLDNSGYFALVEQLLSERWAAYVRYDHLKRDLSAGGDQTLSGPTIGVSWWVATQVRLTFEGQFIDRTGEDNDNLFTTELLWAF